MKKQNRDYHLFLFLSTFSRGLIESFSLVLLYKKSFSLQSILIFLFLTYLFGMVASYFSLIFSKKVSLIISNILYGICFLFLSFFSSNTMLFFLSILFAFSHYSYHTIRHYYALCMLGDNCKTNVVVTLMYLGGIFSSLIGSFLLEKFHLFLISIIVFLVSIFSCIPIFKYREFDIQDNNKSFNVRIKKYKIIFSILEQFKVLFMELQPLFLYLYVKNSYIYIGFFQFIMNLSSLFIGFYLVRYISYQNFKFVTIGLGIVLFLKVYFHYQVILFVIALLEGIFIKIYEMICLKNLYDIGKNNVSRYLMLEEFIFLGSKSLVMLICILMGFSLKNILLFFILGIVCSGFFAE